MNDHEVKVTDLEKNMLKVLEARRDSGELRCPLTALMLFPNSVVNLKHRIPYVDSDVFQLNGDS